jgi:CCR4-NOT transcriptional regulation complex NOT5 subunit
VRKVMSEELDTLQKVVDNWKENDEIPKFFEDLYSKVKTTDNPVIKKEYMEDLKRMVKFLRKAIREKV